MGRSRAANGERHAFITGPNGIGGTDRGTLGGASSGADEINDKGEVWNHSIRLQAMEIKILKIHSTVDLPPKAYLIDAS